jgi:ribonuclease HI
VGLIIHIDGGARGNPGPAGAGVSIRDESGAAFFEAAYFLGTQTNNTAEYLALIRALQRVENQRSQRIAIYSDSELLVRQLTGEYRVKSPKLAQLHEQAQLLLLGMPGWTVRHVRREENLRADELANLAMDRRRDVVVFDAERGVAPLDASGDDADAPAPSAPAAANSSVRSAPPAAEIHAVAHAARVTLFKPPKAGGCVADQGCLQTCIIEQTLPAGLCLHAAHALLPTVLAIMNTDPSEVAGIPTMTVRCMKAGCGAQFHVEPLRGSNGVNRPEKE